MDDKLTELMKILEPDNPYHLTAFDLARLHQLVQEGRVTADHLTALYLAQPEAARQQITAQEQINHTVTALVNEAAAGQQQSLAALHAAMINLTQTMSALAGQINDNPEAAPALADASLHFSEMTGQLADRIQSVNHHNNQTWSRIIATTAISGIGAAAIAAAYLLNREVR
jgi:hypothetical protein